MAGGFAVYFLIALEKSYMNFDCSGHQEPGISFRTCYPPARFLKMLLVAAIFNTLIALFLILIGQNKSFFISLIVSQCYGISIYCICVLLLWVLNPKSAIWRIVGVCIFGTAIGYFVGFHSANFIVNRCLSLHPRFAFLAYRDIVFVLAFSCVGCLLFYAIARFKISEELIQKERINRLSSEKEALEANLRLLQAQIEPHFLFNTLSNILSLIDTDPSQSKRMLADLTHYLRTALSRTLPAVTTLGQEMDMIRAYLDIQKVRMGERLKFTIDLSDDLRQFPFPPMLLQPLVENAVEHGLDSLVSGGTINVKAAGSCAVVRIEVTDTGNGFSSTEKSGIGIANVRERIRLLYGDNGHLLMEENTPHGVRAIIEVPRHDL
jgi:sensor histidine kinase YesM